MKNKGIYFVILTALISGFSIFLNAFAVQGFNPFVFTTMKNLIVGLFLVSAIVLVKELPVLKQLSIKQWQNLVLVGLIGGSIPFLLWFNALKIAGNALLLGFIHKTLFVWVALMAIFYLKEKIDKKFIIAGVLLLIGNFLIFSNMSVFGIAEIMGLIAVLFWGAETVFSKKLLKDLSSRVVAGGRMFFGSIFMIIFLIATNQFEIIFTQSVDQWIWIALTSALLFGYVTTYYAGLKLIPASIAAAILLLGQPITGILSMVFLGKEITAMQGFGYVFIFGGILLLIGYTLYLHFTNKEDFTIATKSKL